MDIRTYRLTQGFLSTLTRLLTYNFSHIFCYQHMCFDGYGASLDAYIMEYSWAMYYLSMSIIGRIISYSYIYCLSVFLSLKLSRTLLGPYFRRHATDSWGPNPTINARFLVFPAESVLAILFLIKKSLFYIK